jgi:leucyl-tRNA synthetase
MKLLNVAEELWVRLTGKPGVHVQPWPDADPEALKVETVTMVVQINGKVRDRVEAAVDAAQEEIEELALQLPRVQELTSGKQIVKIIIVPKKLVNIVTK